MQMDGPQGIGPSLPTAINIVKEKNDGVGGREEKK